MYSWDRAEFEDTIENYPDIVESTRAHNDYLLTTFQEEIMRRERLRKRYGVNRALTTQPMGKERFQAVKTAMSISQILFEFGCPPPRPAGTRQVMPCPLDLHEDSTPSFTIYPGDLGWYCFGCNQGGTIIDLAMMMLKTNDPRVALAHIETLVRDHATRRETVERTLSSIAS